jgi:formylglycine-generating enzyme required for sulfatase activity
MLQAFLETGHFIVCLDGLDEFGIDMPSEGIADHLSRIAELLPRGSKFLVTCRTTHFASFAEMANLATWRESTLAGTMRVLQLSPFGPTELNNYIHVAVESISEPPASRRLRDLINPGDMSTPTALALERCVEEPAILSRLVNELMEVPQLTELELLRSALEGSLIGFNLDAERSSPFHLDSEGEIVEFGVRQRVALLGELAWYMAERDLDAIELTSLPRRIALMFGINCQALQRDLRSQTVFELDRSSNDCGSLYQVDEGIESHVRFGLRMKHVENSQRSTSHDHTLSESSSCSVDSSVAGAYFLANHIVSRLCDHLILPGVRFTDVLRYIGQIELDWVATAILRLMINAGEIDGINAEHLAMSIRAHIMNLAAQGNFAVFDRTIRYLVPNALRMGILTSADAEEIDPWTPDIKAVTSSPPALPRYEMVFIPPVIASHKSLSQPPGTHIDDEPFLLGLHEITNQDYERFIRSERGQEWSPERTRNVSPKGSSTSSEAAQKTNEYNLYFWEPELVDGENVFAPTTNTRNHPVVYVSLYAAKAFCDWLSDDLARSDAKSHYRLLTSAEWVWAAQGPYSNAKYPWDLLPYPIPALEQSDALQTPTSISSSNHHDAINWFNRYRQSTTKVLLDTGRRSNEVGLNDEFTPFAVMGLVGNVKEWVGDLRTDTNDSSKPRKGMVFGGTAHLGEDSFLFGYNAQLYPENTNPDVGFRVARSLSHHELSSLRQREACLAELTLPNRVKG